MSHPRSCLAAALLSVCFLLPAARAAGGETAYLVHDISPRRVVDTFSPGGPFVPVGNRAAFVAWDQASGWEVWASDGTAHGTQMLVDSCPGTCGESFSSEKPVLLGVYRDHLYWLSLPQGSYYRNP